MAYRLSRFCHFVSGKTDGLTAVYNALTLGVVIVDVEIAERLRSLSQGMISADKLETLLLPEVLQQLIQHKLVLPSESQTDLADYLQIQQGLECRRIGILYLMLTDACNLACRYCFVENAMPQYYKFSLMTEATAKEALDLFVKCLASSDTIEEPQIIFYGGEPLMNLVVLEKAIDYISELKLQGKLPFNTSITVNTNGTLVDNEVIRILKKAESLNVAISLDGPAHIHNTCRPYHNQQGSFQDIMRGYRTLSESDIEAGFCCTISRYNVNNLKEIAVWFVKELDAKSLGFNIMIENDAATSLRGELQEYAEQAAHGIIQSFRFFRENGVYEDRIMRKVNSFIEGQVYYYDCGGCGHQLVASPDGLVGVCQGYCGTKKNFVNLGPDLNPLEHPLWNEWHQRSPLSMEQCRDCIALSLCGGGCPYSADIRHGTIWSLDDIFCVHAQKTVTFLLEELIQECAKD